jgi:hypothetical protein
MTGDKENFRNITGNWDKFIDTDFATHTIQKPVRFFHLHNFTLCKVNTNTPQSHKSHQFHTIPIKKCAYTLG